MVAPINRHNSLATSNNNLLLNTISKRNARNMSIFVNNPNITFKKRNNLNNRRIIPTIGYLQKPIYATAVNKPKNNGRRTATIIPSAIKGNIKKVNYVLPSPGIATIKQTVQPSFANNFNTRKNMNKRLNAARHTVTQVNPLSQSVATKFRSLPNNNRTKQLFGNKFSKGSRHLLGGRKHHTKKRRHSHHKRRA